MNISKLNILIYVTCLCLKFEVSVSVEAAPMFQLERKKKSKVRKSTDLRPADLPTDPLGSWIRRSFYESERGTKIMENGRPISRKKNFLWQIKPFFRSYRHLLLYSFVTQRIRWRKPTNYGVTLNRDPRFKTFRALNRSCQSKTRIFQVVFKKYIQNPNTILIFPDVFQI